MAKGQRLIEVTIDIDANSIINVDAIDKFTENSKKLIIWVKKN